MISPVESSDERARLQHQSGRLTASERLQVVLDEGSFEPLEDCGGERILVGRGRINGRPLCVFVQQGGDDPDAREALSRQALHTRVPILTIYDPGEMTLWPQEASRCQRGQAALRNSSPQLAVVFGECFGHQALAVAQADWVFMARPATVLSLSPESHVRAVRYEGSTRQALGGADVNARDGSAHAVFKHEIETLMAVRRFFDYLPLSATAELPCLPVVDPVTRREAGLDTLVPMDSQSPYDMRELVDKVVDEATFFELQSSYGGSVLSGLARVAGRPVGVLANQPEVLAGCLDLPATEKARTLVQFCAAYGLPVVMLADLPGPLPGLDQQRAGLTRAMADLLHAWHAGRMPRVVVFTRRPDRCLPLLSGDAHLVWGDEPAVPAAGASVERWICPADTRVALVEVLSALCDGGDRVVATA